MNTRTHIYPNTRPATLHGWRRSWVATSRFGVVLLTGVEAPGHEIDGLIAAVPDANWTALDARENGYRRVSASTATRHDLPGAPDIDVYAVPTANIMKSDGHSILMSYLDVVVQGFHEVYGDDGVERFFDTTDGWHTPIINDRAAPIYPRSQDLTPHETRLVDYNLARVSAKITSPHGQVAVFGG